MESAAIAVIVPVYNTELFLNQCIQSIRDQTYTNLEVLLIDDGSTDQSGRMCDLATTEDPRFRVIHQSNQGLSAARNTGLSLSSSPYVAFVDSDDWLLPDCLQQLMEYMAAETSDVTMCRLKRTDQYGIAEDSSQAPWANTWGMEEALLYIDRHLSGLMAVSCGKLYKRELFQNIRFPEGRYHEDEFTTYRLLFNAARIGIINRFLYMHRIREHSITQSDLSIPRAKDAIEALIERGLFFQSHGMLSLSLSSFRYAYSLIRDYSKKLEGKMTTEDQKEWRALEKSWAATVRKMPPTIRFRLLLEQIRRRMQKE